MEILISFYKFPDTLIRDMEFISCKNPVMAEKYLI